MKKSKDLERLREERKVVRALATALESGTLHFSNDKGSPRRSLVRTLLKVAAHPDQHTVSPDMVLAVHLVLSLNDKVAGKVLHGVCDGHYLRCIQNAKRARK